MGRGVGKLGEDTGLPDSGEQGMKTQGFRVELVSGIGGGENLEDKWKKVVERGWEDRTS